MSEQVDLLDCLDAAKVEGQFDFVRDFDIDDSMDDEADTSISVIREPVEELSDQADSPILDLGISLTENGKLLLESNEIPVPTVQKTRLQGPGNSNILNMGFDSTGKMEVSDRNLFILDLSYKMDEPDSEELEVFSCLNDQLLPKCGFQLLRVLILRNNRLSSLANMHLAEMPFLTDLDLAHNSLTGTVPIGSFPPTLQRLDLSGNYLDGVAGLICCLSLVSLDISSNSLRSISALPPRLRELDVSHNKLTSITNLRLLSLSPSIISLNIAGNPAAEPYAPFRATVCSLLLKLEKLDGVYLPGSKFKNNRSPTKKIPETEVHRKGGVSKKKQEEADVLRHEEHSRRQLDVKEKRARINENIDLLVRSPCSNTNYSPSHAIIGNSSEKEESFGRFSPGTLSKKGGGGQIPVPQLLGFGAVLKKQQEESDKIKFDIHTKKKIEVIAKKMKNKNKSKESSVTTGSSPHSTRSCVSPSQKAQIESDLRRYEEHARRVTLAQEKIARENEEIDSQCNSPCSRSASPTRKEQAEGDAIRHDQHGRRQLEVIVKREEINTAIDCRSNSPRSRTISPSREAQQRADKERADAYLNKESHIQVRLEELQSVSGHSDFKRGISSSSHSINHTHSNHQLHNHNNQNHHSNSGKSVVSRFTNASTITSQKSVTNTKNQPKAMVHIIPQVPPLNVTKAHIVVAPEIPIKVQGPSPFERASTFTTTSFANTLPQGYKVTLPGERNSTSGISDPRSEIIGNAMSIVNKGMSNGAGNGASKLSVNVTVDIPRRKFESRDSRECGSYTDTASDITFHPPLLTQPGVTAASSKETEGEESLDDSTVADSATEEGKYYVGERVIAEVEAAIQKNNDILTKLVHEIRGSMSKKPIGLRKGRDRKRSRGVREAASNASNICHSMPPVFPPSTLLPSASSSISDEDNQSRDNRHRKNTPSTAGGTEMLKSSEKSSKSARAEKAANMFEKRGPRRSSIPELPVKIERSERERVDQIPPGDHDAIEKGFVSSPSVEEKEQEKKQGQGQKDVGHVALNDSAVSRSISHTDSLLEASVGSWTAHSDISSIALPRKRPQKRKTTARRNQERGRTSPISTDNSPTLDGTYDCTPSTDRSSNPMHVHPKGTGSKPQSAHTHGNRPKGVTSPQAKGLTTPTPEIDRLEQRRGSASSSSSNNNNNSNNRRPSLLSNLYNTTTSSSRAKMSSTVCNLEYGVYQVERKSSINGGVRRSSIRSRGESEHVHVPVQGPRVINGGRRDSKESQRVIQAEAERLKETDRLKQIEIDSCFEWVKRASELMQQLPPPLPATVTVPSPSQSPSQPMSLEEKLLTAEGLYATEDSESLAEIEAEEAARMENIRNINAAASFMRSQIGSKTLEDSQYENLARSRSMDSSGLKHTQTSAEEALGRAGGDQDKAGQDKGVTKEREEKEDSDPSRAVQLDAIIKFFRSQSEVLPGQAVNNPPFPFTFPSTPTPADALSAAPTGRPSRLPAKGHTTPPTFQPVVLQTTSSTASVMQFVLATPLSLPCPPSQSQPSPSDKMYTSVIPPPRSPSPCPHSPRSDPKSHRILHPSALPFPRSPRSLPRPTQPRSPAVSQIVRAGNLPPPSPYSLPPSYSASQSPQSPSVSYKSVPEYDTIYDENPMHALGKSQVRKFYDKEKLAPAAADVDMSESELISLLSTYDSLPLSQLAAVVREIMSDSPHATKKTMTDVSTPHTTHTPTPHTSQSPPSNSDLPLLKSDHIKTPPPTPPPNQAPAPVPVLARPNTPEIRSRLSINTDVRRDAETVGPGTAPPVVKVVKVVKKRTFQKQVKKERKAEKERIRKEEEKRIALELEIEKEKERKEANRTVWSFTGKKSDIWDGKVDAAPFIIGDIDNNKPKDKKPFLKRKVNPLLKAPHGSPNPILKSPVLERRAFKGGDTVPVIRSPLVVGEVHVYESPDCSLFRPSWNDDTHVEPLSAPFPPALRVSKSPPRRDLSDTPPRSSDVSSATTPAKLSSTNSSVTRTDPGSETPAEEEFKNTQSSNKRKEELEMKLKLKVDQLDAVVKSWNDSLVSGDYGDACVGDFDGIIPSNIAVSTSCFDSGLSDTDTVKVSTDKSKKDLKSSEKSACVKIGSGSKKEIEVVKKEIEVVKKGKEVVQPAKEPGLSLREKLQMKLLDCEEKEKEKEKEQEREVEKKKEKLGKEKEKV